MRLSLCFIVLAFFGLLVLGQEAEQQEEQQQTEERPSEGQQVEQQPAETQQTEEQQPNGGQRGGLKACKPTDLFPGPNAILIAPELTVEFDAESKAIRNVSFQAAPGWAPDSLSSCTVGEGRSVPPPGKKTQCANGGIAFGVIEGEDRLLVSNLRRSNAEIVEPPTFQLDFVLINETNTLVGCMTVADSEWGIGILNKDCRLTDGRYVCTSYTSRHGALAPVGR